jgi:hypothetical protein
MILQLKNKLMLNLTDKTKELSTQHERELNINEVLISISKHSLSYTQSNQSLI